MRTAGFAGAGHLARHLSTAVILCIGLAARCGDSGTAGTAVDEKRSSTVDLTLKLDRTDLVIGEDTGLSIEASNTSTSPVTLPDLNASPTWPKMILVNVSTGTRTVFGPTDNTGDGPTHFMPLPPEANRTLSPGQGDSLAATLTQRVRIPEAGSYRLEAEIEIDGRTVTSPPVDLRIAPLDLRAISTAGAHSGPTPFQHILWSQADGDGSILFLTTISVDQEGHPFIVESTRLERIDSGASPVLSVSPNGNPFPGKWIFWVDGPSDGGGGGTSLHGIYVMHGRVEQRLPAQALGVRPHTLIGPALHDFDENDASRPGPGDAVLWSGPDAPCLLKILTATGGTLRQGPIFESPGGRFAWGSTAFLTGGERRVVMAVESPYGVQLQFAQWKRGASGRQRIMPLFDWEGTMTASGAALNAEDDWLGATIVNRPDAGPVAFALHLWTIRRDARAHEQDAIPFDLPGRTGHGRALVGRSPGGRVLALLSDARGNWFTVDREGRCEPLASEFAGLGDPVAILCPSDELTVIVFASPAGGLSIRKF